MHLWEYWRATKNATLKATQGRYKRDHDKRLALRAEKLTVGGCAWLRDHQGLVRINP